MWPSCTQRPIRFDDQQQKLLHIIAKKAQKNWISPTAATLHGDGKQVQTLTNKNVKEER